MNYKIEDLEKMTMEELQKFYNDSSKNQKKNLLKTLGNNRKFAFLMSKLSNAQLVELAKIHPYKEVMLDTMISEMEIHGANIGLYGSVYFKNFKEELLKKTFFDKVKGLFSRSKSLPETLPDKIAQMELLSQNEYRRVNAVGDKLQKNEQQDISVPTTEPRAQVNFSEMTHLFDACKEKCEKDFKEYQKDYSHSSDMYNYIKDNYAGNGGMEDYIEDTLANRYSEIFGEGSGDISRLIAKSEMQNLNGDTRLYNAYSKGGSFSSKGKNGYDSRFSANDTRGWKKNFLEIEQVEDFTVMDKNFGTVYIVKSEMQPTSYAIKDKWAPMYEYYTKTENGEFVRFGSGIFDEKENKRRTTVTLDSSEIKTDFEISEKKEKGQILEFDSDAYTGESTKISRKDIEQAITKKSIEEHLGKNKEIAEIVRVQDLPLMEGRDKSRYNSLDSQPHMAGNAYIVSFVADGHEGYELVSIGDDGKCMPYPGIKKEMFNKRDNIEFPTGQTTGLDPNQSLNYISTTKSLETYKTNDGKEYSIYREDDGSLKIAELVEYTNGNGRAYAEKLDTYPVERKDINKMKIQSRERSALAKENSPKKVSDLTIKKDDKDEI